METKTIQQTVQSNYASLAKGGLSSDHEGVRAVAQAFGYTPEQFWLRFPPRRTWASPAAIPRLSPA